MRKYLVIAIALILTSAIAVMLVVQYALPNLTQQQSTLLFSFIGAIVVVSAVLASLKDVMELAKHTVDMLKHNSTTNVDTAEQTTEHQLLQNRQQIESTKEPIHGIDISDKDKDHITIPKAEIYSRLAIQILNKRYYCYINTSMPMAQILDEVVNELQLGKIHDYKVTIRNNPHLNPSNHIGEGSTIVMTPKKPLRDKLTH